MLVWKQKPVKAIGVLVGIGLLLVGLGAFAQRPRQPRGRMPGEWVQFLKVSSKEIARIRPDGTGEITLYPNPGESPSPSRDGEWLAFLKKDTSGANDLWVRKPDGTIQNLTNTPNVNEYAPAFSWDGQKP